MSIEVQRPQKFKDLFLTADGEERAHVRLRSLDSLWFNTGTLCNLACENCYIESSPKNDRLVYITLDDVIPYFEEIKKEHWPTKLIGFTGGEPFLNPHFCDILETTLSYGFETLVLTNAYRVIDRHKKRLQNLKEKFGELLKIRVSLDHYTGEVHEKERGKRTFEGTLRNIQWLYENGFDISIAGRSLIDEPRDQAQTGYEETLLKYGVNLDINKKLVIFPEMETNEDVPEITTKCWDILKKSPDEQMCSSERMIVKRKGEDQTVVLPCTLLAYDKQFELGHTLKEANKDVYLNHHFCSKFCVLGGSNCSGTK